METCKERIEQEYKDFTDMLDTAYDYYKKGYIEGVGCEPYITRKAENEGKDTEIYDNVRGLLDKCHVSENTFGNNKPYTCYQFSWGGPSDEVRVYEDGTAEYWFLDWFDGASKKLSNKYLDILESIYE
jgi:hypothetical protein